MGWRDDPIVQAPTGGSWRNDPIVEEPSVKKQLTDFAVGTLRKVKAAYEGKHDPRYRDVPEWDAQGVDPKAREGIATGEMFSQGDEELAGVVQKQLGDQFISVERDENGYHIINYRSNVDGQPKKVYLNKPGYTSRDFLRFTATSLPYVMGSSVAGGKGKLALPFRMMAQGVTGAGTSLGMDVAARQMGSEQAPDVGRAVGAGAGGALAEPVSRGLGALVGVLRSRGMFAGGKLTAEGRSLVAKHGYDPDQFTAAAGKQMARDVAEGADKKAAVTKGFVESKGLKGTVGDYTGDVEQQLAESELRRGERGHSAVGTMKAFDDSRTATLENANKQFSAEKFGHATEVPAGSGTELQGMIRERYAEAKKPVDEAFEQYDPAALRPRMEDKATLTDTFQSLKQEDPHLWNEFAAADPKAYPQASNALNDLNTWASKKGLKTKGRKLLGSKATELDFEQLRKRLTGYREQAVASGNNSDIRMTSHVADKYNDFLIEAASDPSNPLDAMRYLKALDMHRSLMHTFGTRGRAADDPGGRFIQDLIHKEATPEKIIDRVLGAGNSAPREAVPIIRRLKEVLGPDSMEMAILKATAWYKLTTKANANLEAGRMVDQGRTLIEKNSVYRELFEPDELHMINDYLEGLNVIRDKRLPPNIKSKELSEFQRVRRDGFRRFFTRKMGTRATFQGRPFESFGWNFLSKSRIVSPVNIQDAAGNRLAKKAVSGELPRGRRPSLAGVGGRAGAYYEDF